MVRAFSPMLAMPSCVICACMAGLDPPNPRPALDEPSCRMSVWYRASFPATPELTCCWIWSGVKIGPRVIDGCGFVAPPTWPN